MPRNKKGIAFMFIIGIISAMIVATIFGRSLLYAHTNFINKQEVKYIYDTHTKGTMVHSFLNNMEDGAKFSIMLGSSEVSNFPRVWKDSITETLKDMKTLIGGQECFITLKTGNKDYEYNKNNQQIGSIAHSATSGQQQHNPGIVIDSPPVKKLCITSSYGWRGGSTNIGSTTKWQFHKGVDFRGDGQPVYAVAGGIVEKAVSTCERSPVNFCNNLNFKNTNEYKNKCNCNNGYGNLISIKHNGFYTYYYHLDGVSVNVGDNVKEGDKIGTIGNSGHSSGPHLHFGVGKTPFEMPYRADEKNFYNPCTVFSNSIMQAIESESSSVNGCVACASKCTDNTISRTNSQAVEMCINSNSITTESATIPLVGGKSGTIDIICY
ncbi:MAG: M23 family metallopeptidase [Candidatus Micrarchaeota archaeon]|nr:M23 family metallopeptidase [Candidatus Micrarchaeota archaeon]